MEFIKPQMVEVLGVKLVKRNTAHYLQNLSILPNLAELNYGLVMMDSALKILPTLVVLYYKIFKYSLAQLIFREQWFAGESSAADLSDVSTYAAKTGETFTAVSKAGTSIILGSSSGDVFSYEL